MGSYVFSAFQSQFPAWTRGAFDTDCDLALSGRQPRLPRAAALGSSWTRAPSQVTATATFVPFYEQRAAAGLSTLSRSGRALLIWCGMESQGEVDGEPVINRLLGIQKQPQRPRIAFAPVLFITAPSHLGRVSGCVRYLGLR